jgi:hypothetical protein
VGESSETKSMKIARKDEISYAVFGERSSGSSKASPIQLPFIGASWPKPMARSMNSTRRQYPLVPGTIFHREREWNTIRDTTPPNVFDPDRYSFEVVHKS